MRRWIGIVAFVASFILAAASVFTLCTAPTSLMWIAAILITEWGHYAAIAALILAALTFKHRRLGAATAMFALVAAILCITPAFRAAQMARELPDRCSAAFGASPIDATPFSFARLFRLVPTREIDVREHVYAREKETSLKLDLYQKRGVTQPQPIVIMVHPGSWKGGKKSQLPGANFHLAQQGYAVAAINYRHAPTFQSPVQVEDVFRALDYLKSRANELHLDPSRIAFIGRSAGGQIALSAGYSGREPNLRGVVALYAPSDVVLGYEEPSEPLVLDSRKVLRDYLGGSPQENPQGYAAASAINFVSAAPPTLLIHGALDPIVRPNQSRLLAAKLREINRPNLLVDLPWATHGCDANPSGPSGQLSLYAIDRMLAAVFAK
ncbi:MAG: alpha/beta hydrolase fold domain-containing protein [Chthoniobacterales bacterium]